MPFLEKGRDNYPKNVFRRESKEGKKNILKKMYNAIIFFYYGNGILKEKFQNNLKSIQIHIFRYQNVLHLFLFSEKKLF